MDGAGGQILRPAGALHGDCFYLGLCEPLNDTESRIRETTDYINDAERLVPAECPQALGRRCLE